MIRAAKLICLNACTFLHIMVLGVGGGRWVVRRHGVDLFENCSSARSMRASLRRVIGVVGYSTTLQSHARGRHCCLRRSLHESTSHRGSNYPYFTITIYFRNKGAHRRVYT